MITLGVLIFLFWIIGLIYLTVCAEHLQFQITKLEMKINEIIEYQEKNPKIRTVYCAIPDKE